MMWLTARLCRPFFQQLLDVTHPEADRVHEFELARSPRRVANLIHQRDDLSVSPPSRDLGSHLRRDIRRAVRYR